MPTYVVVRMLSSSETLSTPEEPSGGEEQVEVTQLHRDIDVHGQEEEDDSLRESVPRRPLVSASLLEPSQVVSEPPRDPELVHLEMQLDMWCTDMKRNILVSPMFCSMYCPLLIHAYVHAYKYVCTYISTML